MLSRVGHRVETTGCVSDALERLDAGRYDLLVADLLMPGRTGFDLLGGLRRREHRPPCVVITGQPSDRVERRVRRLGASDMVPKPFTRDELCDAVRRALALGPRPVPLPGPHLVPPGSRIHHLPGQTWAWLDADGDGALVGLEPDYAERVGDPAEVRLSSVGDELEQGLPCATLVARDGRLHCPLSPLSGRVVACNRAVLDDPRLVARSPDSAGWLLRLHVEGARHQLHALVPRRTSGRRVPDLT